ncbi:hypothetical protein ACLI4Y_07225 [Natrialbaceae archaeon A-CW3]
MAGEMTVGEILEKVRKRRRQKRCPDCDATVTIRGLGGEYRWECLECDTLGIGYRTRSEALSDLRRLRG